MRTPVCELLGIGQPVVLAPIAGVPRLAAAVSNAGALGTVGLTWTADIAGLVRETAALTARPFAGNLVLIGDMHQRFDQALAAGLRIVLFFWGDPAATSTRCTAPGPISPRLDQVPGNQPMRESPPRESATVLETH